MPKYRIYAGLGGSFGGGYYQYTTDDDYTKQQASEEAYEQAIEVYESYAGLHGLMDYSEALEQAEQEIFEYDYETREEWQKDLEDYALDVYNQEVENWIDYWVEEDESEIEE